MTADRTAEERAREIRREARIKERKRCARIARVYRQQDPYISEEAEQASREIERQIIRSREADDAGE